MVYLLKHKNSILDKNKKTFRYYIESALLRNTCSHEDISNLKMFYQINASFKPKMSHFSIVNAYFPLLHENFRIKRYLNCVD